jgi:hypothetical protein
MVVVGPDTLLDAVHWSVSLTTYAEICPPALNLKSMRAKLTGSR